MSHRAAIDEHARVGVDIGRVIIAAVASGGRADTSFIGGTEEDAMRTPPVNDAFRVVARLVERTGGNVWLVSKAGPRIEALTRRWLVQWRFLAATNVPDTNVVFCRERRDKADHAVRLRLTHFIDDRVDVLEHLRAVMKDLYLFGHQAPDVQVPPWAVHVLTWQAVERALLGEPPCVAGT